MATAAIVEADQQAPPIDGDSSKKRKSQIDEIEVDLSLPEPPSKKAKRLLKKGKPLPEKPKSDDEAESEDELPVPKGSGKGGKGDKKSQRSEHSIWIGNLPFTMTRVELFKWLVESSGGTIKEENITRVNLPTSKTKRYVPGEESSKPQNKGFAYVDFNAESASIAAMALTETEIDGRKVLIKNSSSFEGRPKKENGTENGASGAANGGAGGSDNKNGAATSKKIYVGNLAFQTNEDDLRAQFDKCGDIEWVKVATFEDSGKCKGYGWVKFKEAEAAAWAVKGFVKIKEEIETEDDFRDKDAASEDGAAPEVEKKFKMRKWWINRLKGRELKIELAEDDQVRYKKRFGKDAPAGGKKAQGPRRDTRSQRPARVDKEGDGGAAFAEKSEGSAKPSYGDAAVASYLTGAVVKPQGKKITFD
ncbi:hypothetical protein F5Y04DRAFT_73550 [Hypomontagnella monticulosa]|nr:hypothetical protein F5Y04DRAFT_73550 [Hypomontagnella monticulosa]